MLTYQDPSSEYLTQSLAEGIMPTNSRTASRRAKKIENNLMRQIVIFVTLTVVLVAALIFVVIPNAIRMIGGKSVTKQLTAQPSGVPPQTPFLAAPVEATNSAQLTITGFSQKGNQVVLLDNTIEVARSAAQDDGSFSIPVSLQTGDNLITSYAIAANNQQSAVSQAYLVNYNTQAPKLELTSPTDGQSVVGSINKQLKIAGTTDPNTKVTINDGLLFVNADGTFSTTFQLNGGDNGLDFKATNPAGNQTEKKVTVHFAN